MNRNLLGVAAILVGTVCLAKDGAPATESSESLSITAVELETSVKDSFFKRQRSAHVLVDPTYRIWDRTVIRWKDGRYHAYYSRWAGVHPRWLTDSEVCHAVADKPEGPFKDTGVVLENRNADGWDLVTAHSQFALVAKDKVLLYYQSCDLRGTFRAEADSPFPNRQWLDDQQVRKQVLRNSQRLGMAMSDNPAGPFVRVDKPVATPDDSKRIKNITDNPAVAYRDGRYLLIMKSDDASKKGMFRIQVAGHSKAPQGPYTFNDKPVYAKKQTEDATIWHDKTSNRYYMVCHVMGEPVLAMFTSADGLKWHPASQPVLMKKEFLLSNGEIWKPERVEQPRVLTDDDGLPVMLYVAVADKDINGNIAVPLKSSRKESH